MNNYYFTFGQGHYNNQGKHMNNCWVRVQAINYTEARIAFIEKFSSLLMPKPDTWAFQYNEQDFQPDWFPEGEYQLITT